MSDAPRTDKSFDGLIRQMGRDITELQRRLGASAGPGLTLLRPDPTTLVNATLEGDGTIILNSVNDDFCLIPGVFATGYKSYMAVYSIGGTGAANSAIFRYMQGATVVSTSAAYGNSRYYVTTAGAFSGSYLASSYGQLGAVESTMGVDGSFQVFDPVNPATRTSSTFDSVAGGLRGSGGTLMAAAESYDGIAFQRGPVGGAKTTTGWVKLYGYR